jgi:hypothetical protein
VPPPRQGPSWPRQHKFLTALIVALALGIIIAAANAVNQTGGLGPSGGTGGGSDDTITYQVSSSGPRIIDVTWGIGGHSQQNTSPSNPWQVTDQLGGDDPTFASLVAQNGPSGDITCVIRSGGKVIAQSASHGAYAVVQCSP